MKILEMGGVEPREGTQYEELDLSSLIGAADVRDVRTMEWRCLAILADESVVEVGRYDAGTAEEARRRSRRVWGRVLGR